MRLLLFTDLHLSEGTRELSAKLLDEILKRNDYDGILHLGDLFNQKDRIPNYLNKIIIDFVSELQAKDKFFYTLYGNHDGYIRDCPSAVYLNKFGDNVKLITEPCEIDDFLFLPYTENTETLIPIILKSKAKYCCIHNDIIGLSLLNNCKLDKGLPLDIFSKFEKVFCGHIHQPQIKDNLYCLGNPYARNFTEASPYNKPVERGYYIFDDIDLEFIKFDAPYYVKIIVDNKDKIATFNKVYEGKKVHLWLEIVDENIDIEISPKIKVLSKIITRKIDDKPIDDSIPVLSIDELENYLKECVKGVKGQKLLLNVGKQILKHFGIG